MRKYVFLDSNVWLRLFSNNRAIIAKIKKIIKIDLDYINYLKEFEPNICHPKDFGYTRPYIGILAFETSDFYYFAPLTSQPKAPVWFTNFVNNEFKPFKEMVTTQFKDHKWINSPFIF